MEVVSLPLVRTLLAMLITISLAIGPAGSAFAASHASGAKGISASARAGSDMADCHKSHQAAKSSPRKACGCCDTQSACPDPAACFVQCCKVLGTVEPTLRLGSPAEAQYSLAEQVRPPGRGIPPLLTPPRS